jgi:hypothetical protein
MLTFFAALLQKMAISPSLKLFFSVIIGGAETVSAGLQKTNIGDMKKVNRIDPLNVQ